MERLFDEVRRFFPQAVLNSETRMISFSVPDNARYQIGYDPLTIQKIVDDGPGTSPVHPLSGEVQLFKNLYALLGRYR